MKLQSGKTNSSRFVQLFGVDEYGFTLLPTKISNVQISRHTVCRELGYCERCFPHGWETKNSHGANTQRSWKKHRKTQWKEFYYTKDVQGQVG